MVVAIVAAEEAGTAGVGVSLDDFYAASSAGRAVGLWPGREMIVFAGFNSGDVAAYDAERNRWRQLPSLPGQLPPTPAAMWNGSEVIAAIGTLNRASVFALDEAVGGWVQSQTPATASSV